VAANTSTTMTLFFAATPNQPTGTFPGTIHITHRTATLAQPLPVSLTVAQDTTAPVLSILTPADNSTVSSSAIVVAGTVTDDTPVAVVVNDVSAEVNDNNFIANNVLLSPGSNTITVEATDVGGNTRRSEISIQVSNPVQNMEISAVPSSGLAPLAVTFSVSPFLAKPPVALMGIDFDGDGTIDFSSATSLAANHIYQSQGVYLTRVLLKDADGNSFSDEFAINVYPPPPFREIWAAMRSALLRKDTDTALFYFTDRSTPTYREVFEKLGTNLRTVAGGLPDPSQLQVVDVREGTARLTFPLTVQANGPEQEATFDLYFRRDDSRFWKIDKF